MSGLRRALGLVAIEGIVVGLVALAIILSSDHVEARGVNAALGLFIGWSWIGVGLFAWWRRPDNRFGVLMTAVGFAFFLNSLSAADATWLFTIGVLVSSLYAGRLRPHAARLSRRAAGVAAAAPRRGRRVRDLRHRPAAVAACGRRRNGSTATAARSRASSSRTTTRCSRSSTCSPRRSRSRWSATCSTWSSSASRRRRTGQRRAMAPVIWSGVSLLVVLAGSLTTMAVDGPEAVGNVTYFLSLVFFAFVPYGFLFGLLRSRVLQAGAVTELLHRMSEGSDRSGAARPAVDRARRPLAAGRLLARGQAPLGRRRGPPGRAPRRRRPRARLHARRARGPRGGRDRARPLAVRRPGARRLGRRRRGPVDRERAPAGPAARARRGAARLARPDRRGRHRRAAPARAQPARRRPAAARRPLAHAARSPRGSCTRTPTARSS